MVNLRVSEKLKELEHTTPKSDVKEQATTPKDTLAEKQDFNSVLIREARDFYRQYKANSLFVIEQRNKLNAYIESGDYMGDRFSPLSTAMVGMQEKKAQWVFLMVMEC